MQNKQSASRSRHVQSGKTSGAKSRYGKDTSRDALTLLGILSAFVPPLGVLLVWRAKRIDVRARAALSALALCSMTLIFCLFLRPSDSSVGVRPTPVVPDKVGYGVANEPTQPPEAAYSVPAAPDAVAPAEGSSDPGYDPSADPGSDLDADQTGALTPQTTVYAVTNNASSYHLYEICETQTNNRALTLQQALDEGLKPCEKCVGAVG